MPVYRIMINEYNPIKATRDLIKKKVPTQIYEHFAHISTVEEGWCEVVLYHNLKIDCCYQKKAQANQK